MLTTTVPAAFYEEVSMIEVDSDSGDWPQRSAFTACWIAATPVARGYRVPLDDVACAHILDQYDQYVIVWRDSFDWREYGQYKRTLDRLVREIRAR